MRYKIRQYSIVGDMWKKAGLPPLKGFIDNDLTIVTGFWTLDILRLDDWLHRHYGDYEDSGKSMKEFIKYKFGVQTAQLIEDLL